MDQCRIYTTMDISADPIAVVMGKGRDDKCGVVGQDSFASPTGCRWSHCRSCLRSTVTGHSTTDVMTPVTWLWCQQVWGPISGHTKEWEEREVHECNVQIVQISVVAPPPSPPKKKGGGGGRWISFKPLFPCIQFDLVPFLDRLGRRGDMRDDSAEILLKVFSAGDPCEQLWHGHVCSLFNCCLCSIPSADNGVAHSPRCPEGEIRDPVVLCDTPEPCKFPSLDSCQEKILWTHKQVDLVPHPVVGLVFQVGDNGEVSS